MLSFSQSHLIVNIKIEDSTQEDSGSMLSFVDLVGFDSLFTQKIMDGSSFSVNNISQFQKAEEEEEMNDQNLKELIADCNDNNLISLKNLLLAIENDEEKSL